MNTTLRFMPRSLRARTMALAAATVLAVTSCGGGGSGSGNSGGGVSLGVASGAGDFVIQDAPITSLLAFTATVSGVFLENVGNPTSNLLPAPVTVEFLGLQGTVAWLSAVDTLPTGTYDSLRITFQPLSYSARAKDGTSVAVSATSNAMTVNFATPFVVDGSGYDRFEIDLNLSDSLGGDVSSPPISFDPAGAVSRNDGSLSISIDEFKGVVKSFDAGGTSLVVDAFVDEDLTLPLGEVTVRVLGPTLLYRENNTLYPDAATFFSDLVASQTLLEIHGQVGASRVVDASKIEIEDQTAGASSSGIVKIEGLVAAIVPGVSFDLTIREIEKGGSIAEVTLMGLGSPSTITVSFDGNTLWFLDSNTPVSQAALVLGQEVKVKFASFATSPFPASVVEIEDAFPEFHGTITDVSMRPASLTIRLDRFDPALLSGQVTSTSTDVTVNLSSSTLVLDTDGEPNLVGVAFRPGLEVRIDGLISGSPGTPTLSARETEVRPGRLKDAMVSSVTPGSSSFTTSGGNVKDPFGGGLVSGPMNILIDPSCVFDDDATTEAQFFGLFMGLGTGEMLDVEVKGIATSTPNEILAFEIKAKLERP